MNQVDHIGIAVASLDEAIAFYTNQLGMSHIKTEIIQEQNVKVAFIDAGNICIELLEATNEKSSVAKFLQKRGPGLHHIAYRVEDIESRIVQMNENGLLLLTEAPQVGANGAKIIFMHPSSAGGVLTEVCEKQEELT